VCVCEISHICLSIHVFGMFIVFAVTIIYEPTYDKIIRASHSTGNGYFAAGNPVLATWRTPPAIIHMPFEVGNSVVPLRGYLSMQLFSVQTMSMAK